MGNKTFTAVLPVLPAVAASPAVLRARCGGAYESRAVWRDALALTALASVLRGVSYGAYAA